MFDLYVIFKSFLENCARVFVFCRPLVRLARFVTYVFIGAIAVSCDFLSFVVLYAIFKTPYVNIASYLFGTFVSFILNATLNFKVYDKWHVRYIKLVVIAGFGSLWSTWLIKKLVIMKISAILAKILVLPLVLIYQYLLAKVVVYRS